MVTFIAILAAAAASILAWIGKRSLAKLFNDLGWLKNIGESPEQHALDEQRKMGQDVADTPDQAQAVKDLEDDKV